MMEAFLKDLKHSLRMFVQSPAFTLAAVAALTLGIGANTAIFSVVNAVLLKPVAVPDPDRVVVFMNVSPRGSRPGGVAGEVRSITEQQTDIVQDVSAFNTGVVNYTGGTLSRAAPLGPASRPTSSGSSARRFSSAARFTPEEDRPNGPRVTVISRQPLGNAVQRRSEHRRQDDLARRRAVHDRRRARRTSTSASSARRRRCGCRSSSIRTRPTRATTSRCWRG